MKDGVAVLREVSSLGGFFSLDTSLRRKSWAPMASLIDGSGELAASLDRTATALGSRSMIEPDQVERRVAASIMHQSLMARLISPALASAAIAGWVPRMELARMWWQPTEPSPIPVCLPDPHGQHAQTPDELAQLISLLVLDDAMAALSTAIEIETGLSPHISWGNVASSVVGAGVMVARQRPDVAATAAGICRDVLATKNLTAAGAFEATGHFRRTSCCLYYRLPHGGLCGDCALGG